MIRHTFALFLALASAAHATVDGWPALYDVADVAEGDVLNVRAAPNASAEIIATLAPDATGIEVLGVNRAESWGRINSNEGIGWVSMAYLDRRPGQWAGNGPETARCFGTEPFWSLALNAGVATFESPDALPLEFAPTISVRSNNRIDAHGRVYESELGGFVATLRNATCSDGMSDRQYGWSIDVLLVVAGEGNAQMFSGCCSLAVE